MESTAWKVLVAVVLAAAICSGCGGKPAASGDENSARGEESVSGADARPEASAVLSDLLTTYREAKSYSDQGRALLRFRQNGEWFEDQWKTSVAFQRPNRLFVQAFQATIACDGKELRGRIEDAETNHVDGQFLVRPAPQELKLKDLASDTLLYDILSSQLRRQPIQLELLLESQGLASAFREEIACQLLADASIEGRLCRRVEVPSPGGNFIFWVDAKESILRRLEYPAAALLPGLAQDPSVSELSLTAELTGAELNPRLSPEQFALAIPSGAKRMRSLVIPPRPLPTDLFGKAVEDFFLTTLNEEKLRREDLAERIAVLVWFRDDPACQAPLQQVEQVRLELADDKRATFYAVSTDPTTRRGDELATLLASWQVGMPLVRDLEAFGDSVFKIQVQPTIIVLDGRGRVQIVQAGGGPDLARQLGVILERLLKGEDVAAEILKRAAAERAEYEKLIASGGPPPTELLEIPETVIRKRTEPKRLKLEELWTNKETKSPGNLCVFAGDDKQDHLLVITGWRGVTELTAEGKPLSHHELPIPAQAAVTYLRTAKDSKGRRHYLAAAPLAPELYLFDEDWKLKLTHPSSPGSPLQLGDAQLAWLEGADELSVYAGYVDLVGLQSISLDGKVNWRSRSFPNVLSVAVVPGKSAAPTGSGLFLSGDAGTVLQVNGAGKEQPPGWVRTLDDKLAISHITAAPFVDAKQASFLGIASGAKGEFMAVGFDAALKRWWHYLLPPGAHQRPIEPVTSGELLPERAGTWVIAGPDGSIHFISEDGELTDSFYYGAAITGIAICKINSAPALVVATDAGVTAWKVH